MKLFTKQTSRNLTKKIPCRCQTKQWNRWQEASEQSNKLWILATHVFIKWTNTHIPKKNMWYISQHISKSSCQTVVDLNDFKAQLKAYKDKYMKENHKTSRRQSMAKQREQDEDKVKESQTKRKIESRRHQRATDEGKVKEIQNKHKKESIAQ